MAYDGDKTGLILEQLKAAVQSGRMAAAMQLLRYADAGGGLRRDAAVLSGLRAAVGEAEATKLVRAFAGDTCRYCAGGREKCDECDGRGVIEKARVCEACAGIGLRRCPFCNGTSLVGYDFVPRGLRPSVLAIRVKFAESHLRSLMKGLNKTQLSVRDASKMIIELDRCRGILANAVEQVRRHVVGAPTGRPLYTLAEQAHIEKGASELHVMAETAIRAALPILANALSVSAEQPAHTAVARTVLLQRAKFLIKLSRTKDFGDSALRTPRVFRAS